MPGQFSIQGANFGKGDVVDMKSVNKGRVVRGLWRYAKKYKLFIGLVLFCVVVGNVIALLSPVVIGEAVDTMATGTVDFAALFPHLLQLGLIYLASFLLGWGQNFFMVRVTQNTIYDIRTDLFNHISELPMNFFDKNYKGDIISRICYDIDNISSCFSTDVVNMLTGGITIVGSLCMMFWEDSLLTVIFLIIVPITAVFTKKITAFTRKLFRTQQYEYGRLSAYAEEMLSNQRVVKAYHQEKETTQQFTEINTRLNEAGFQAQFYSSVVMPTMNLVNNLGFLLTSSVGAVLVLGGRITVGELSSFVLYSKKFAGPINEIANILGVVQSAFAASERVFTILEQPTEPMEEEKRSAAFIRGDVTFSHVCFAYEQGEEVLHDINLTVKAGQKVAIVGHTGSGKTTLANLLMRFYDVTSGDIFIDGVSIRDIDRRSLRKLCAMVLQDSWLFAGTVTDNIRYGKEEASFEEVKRAAKDANADPFIREMRSGYDTPLSEEESVISAGQRQLLSISRAMLADPKILVLDEATSSVDTITERRIQEAMDRIMQGRTSFVIAHRLSTIVNADLIVVLQDGHIVEQGTHEQLLKHEGAYYAMYQSQFMSL